ncbi:unnamed protein product [Amoebophrya sp. A25]|nr:unnamed protein product [Amoebophrya sp. A25]|eukprot:GSA25T00025472001.1
MLHRNIEKCSSKNDVALRQFLTCFIEDSENDGQLRDHLEGDPDSSNRLIKSSLDYLASAFLSGEEGFDKFRGDVCAWAVCFREKLCEISGFDAGQDDGVEVEQDFLEFFQVEDADGNGDQHDQADENSGGQDANTPAPRTLDFLEEVVEKLVERKFLYQIAPCPFDQPGVRVLAILTEDGQYHPAVVEREVHDLFQTPTGETTPPVNGGTHAEVPAPTKASSAKDRKQNRKETRENKKNQKKLANAAPLRFFEVRFSEFGKVQLVKEENLIYDDAQPLDDGERDMGEGECELCGNFFDHITFHHLVPKSTHRRYLRRKKWPAGVNLPRHMCRGLFKYNRNYVGHNSAGGPGSSGGSSSLVGSGGSRSLGVGSGGSRSLQNSVGSGGGRSAAGTAKSGRNGDSGGVPVPDDDDEEEDLYLQNYLQRTSSTTGGASTNNNSGKNHGKPGSSPPSTVNIIEPPNRILLNCYGAMLCGKCHAHVHRLAGNDVLATDFNTVAKLKSDPRMQAWLSFKQ